MSISSMTLPVDAQFPTTSNTILGGALSLTQPLEGYRASIDPIFLAASVQAVADETVLELGTGVGTALLALGHRLSQVRGTGLEFQRDICRLASHNIKTNALQGRLEAIQGDLTTPPPRLVASSFSHVMANPPYYESHTSPESDNPIKALSNHDQGISLETWVNFAYRMLKSKGYVSFIFLADRTDDLIMALYGKFGGMTIFPLWPKAGVEAKRVIVQARKSVNSPARLLPGLVIHQEGGSYTPEAQAILRDGKGLDFGR